MANLLILTNLKLKKSYDFWQIFEFGQIWDPANLGFFCKFGLKKSYDFLANLGIWANLGFGKFGTNA